MDRETISPGEALDVVAEVYGTDILRIVESGMRLRRSLMDAGDTAIAEIVSDAVIVIQNLLGLPGQPQQFYEFLATQYDGYDRQRRGQRFDHQAPRSKLADILKKGLAGSNHGALSAFLADFDDLRLLADKDNPGRRRFDQYIRCLAQDSNRSLVVFSNALQLSFAEWRIETDPSLSDIRPVIVEKLVLVDSKEVVDQLDRGQQEGSPIDRIAFIEPRADDFLHILTRPGLPRKAVILANLAQVEQVLRRIRILLTIDGLETVANRLSAVQTELARVQGGHTSDFPDLDEELRPRFGTLDLAGTVTPWSGSLRIIQVSGNVHIRAFDGTEVPFYEPEALQHFSRKLAKDLRAGDEICLLSPEFVSVAREKLNFSANAPEVLKLYHKAVAAAAKLLPGWDMTAKTAALRARMLQNDPGLDLPGPQAMRHWIDVAAGVCEIAVVRL
jgi:hypothetical protein